MKTNRRLRSESVLRRRELPPLPQYQLFPHCFGFELHPTENHTRQQQPQRLMTSSRNQQNNFWVCKANEENRATLPGLLRPTEARVGPAGEGVDTCPDFGFSRECQAISRFYPRSQRRSLSLLPVHKTDSLRMTCPDVGVSEGVWGMSRFCLPTLPLDAESLAVANAQHKRACVQTHPTCASNK